MCRLVAGIGGMPGSMQSRVKEGPYQGLTGIRMPRTASPCAPGAWQEEIQKSSAEQRAVPSSLPPPGGVKAGSSSRNRPDGSSPQQKRLFVHDPPLFVTWGRVSHHIRLHRLGETCCVPAPFVTIIRMMGRAKSIWGQRMHPVHGPASAAVMTAGVQEEDPGKGTTLS